MARTKRTLELLLVVAALGLMTAVPLRAAETRNGKGNWDSLKQLAPGEQIQIVLNDAKSYRGQFQTVSDEAIVVRLATGEQTFSRESVLRVSTEARPHRSRNALIGAGIGFGSCTAAGAAYAASQRREWPQNRYAEVGAIIGAVACAPVGALTGALVSREGWGDVYRAR